VALGAADDEDMLLETWARPKSADHLRCLLARP
jgi:hypothetical protein